MMPELGHFALIQALFVAVILCLAPVCGLRFKRSDWISASRTAAYMLFALVALSYGLLTHAFIDHDFSVLYVANTSNSELPLIYRLSGVWGAHEGSLLLWVLILSGWAAVVAFRSNRYPPDMAAGVLSVMGLISIGFITFTLFTSNPFERHFPPPVDGADLNPLLQDPVMAIHPPMLYMGYVGFVVPFAFAVTALIQGRLDSAWARWVRPWAITAWLFLTAGITLGSWWAYYELGWGGWWFWDPVENASFLPWLVGTALIHSLIVTEKRKALRNWTLLLCILGFSLSLLGTFLVRSGVLTSVHAFASDPTRGIFILAFLGVVIGSSLALFAWRAWDLRTLNPVKLVSREMALLANSVLLMVAMITVLLGTIYPLILEAVSGEKISVGPPYFDQVFVPIFLPILLLMGMGPFIRWREQNFGQLLLRLRWPLVAALSAATLFLFLLPGPPGFAAWAWLLICFWIVFSCIALVRERVGPVSSPGQILRRVPRGWYGMITGHLGIAFVVFGISMSTLYSQDVDVVVGPGDSRQLGAYRFEFSGVEKQPGINYSSDIAAVNVYHDDQFLFTLHPEKRFYPVRQNVMTEAAIDSNPVRDLYVSLGDPRAINTGQWTMRFYYKPFILWIWLGGFTMVAGGLIALLERRFRAEARAYRVDIPGGVNHAG